MVSRVKKLCVAIISTIATIAIAATVTSQARAQESALPDLARAAKKAPADAQASLAYGRALTQSGHSSDAITELRRGIGQWNARAGDVALDLHWELARAYLSRRETGPAIIQCQIIQNKPGGAAFGHACAAEAWLASLRASETHFEVKEALKSADIPARVRYQLHVSEGIASSLELKYADAESELGAAIALNADGVDAHIALGKLLAQEGKDGAPDLRQAVAADPKNADALYELARISAPGPDAVPLLTRAATERPTFGAAYRLLAATELAQHHNAEAKRAADNALRIDPQDVASHLVMGDVALAEGRFDDALREGQIAITLVGNSASARLLVADAYAKKGEIDLALESYQAAYGFDHTNPAALVHASEACLQSSRPTSAKAFGEKATQEFPDYAPAWVALGDALVAYQDPLGARRAYEQSKRVKGPVDAAAVDRKLAALHL